jgi:hypothetical protein
MRTRPSARFAASIAVASLLALPRPTRAASTDPAAEAPSGGFAPTVGAGGFGDAGQIALSLGATADEHFFFHKSGGAWQLQLAPAADYFLFAHVSVGGVVAYEHDSGGGGTGTNGLGRDTFRIGARAGYSVAINDRFSVWPLAGLRLDYTSANHTSQTDTYLPIYVPALFHLAPHFFVGVGPDVTVHLSGGLTGGWGVDSLLGGWF